MEYAKTIVRPIKQVAHRSTIRGFRDDYHHIDADVVILAGETHLYRKPVSRLSYSHLLTPNRRCHSVGGHALYGGPFACCICKHGRA